MIIGYRELQDVVIISKRAYYMGNIQKRVSGGNYVHLITDL